MGRKRRKYEDRSAKGPTHAADTNVEIIVPAPAAAAVSKTAEEPRKPSMSRKKKKRLEAYILKKLKKEERIKLFEKLSKSTFHSELMKSTKTLGNAKETTRERLKRALYEERAGFAASDPSVRLVIEREVDPEAELEMFGASASSGESDSGDSDSDGASHRVEVVMGDHRLEKPPAAPQFNPFDSISFRQENAGAQPAENLSSAAVPASVSATSVVVGSALKKPTAGVTAVPSGASVGVTLPPLRKRKKKAPRVRLAVVNGRKIATARGVDTSSDASFDSSNSEYDTDRENATWGTSDGPAAPENHDRVIGFVSEDENGVTEAVQLSVPAVKGVLDDSIYVSPDIEVVPKKRKRLETDTGKVAGEHTRDKSKAYYVRVKRKPEIQKARMELPVCAEEQNIIDTIRNNPVTILCGETGSGKTTQVPQFLFEAGYGHPQSDNPGMIGCTQPRRVAAISMAKRVAEELNVSSAVVSYQIRYDATVSDYTAIKFMTDGVLLRELAADLLLKKYSVLIIDEAHERSLNTDIIIGVVSRVVKLRDKMHREAMADANAKPGSPVSGPGPLRVVIMSATLRVQDFTENTRLFETPPPVVKVEARQYPVSVHFSRKTPLEQGAYMDEALKKVSRIHKRLPEGGILVFLTGQAEIAALCNKLRRRFPAEPVKGDGRHQIRRKTDYALYKDDLNDTGDVDARNAPLESEDVQIGQPESKELEGVADEDSAAVETARILNEDKDRTEDGAAGEEVFDDLDGSDEDEKWEDEAGSQPLHVLPLYSLLSTEHQLRVFKPPPAGTRLCVVATNVAETSLTIPGIKYVCDCGREKKRIYDVETGVQSYEVSWASKAAADQRAGRAGRTGPGHCYRLYSSAVYDQRFRQFTHPEILRMPVDGVVLQMKSMNIDSVCNFPFPTPPERDALVKAERLLGFLGALDVRSANDANGRITDLGRTMSAFPLAPRFAKMLAIGQQHGCLPYIISVVSALTVGDPFIGDSVLGEAEAEDCHDGVDGGGDGEQRQTSDIRRRFAKARAAHAGQNPTSDLLRLLNVVGAYEFTPEHKRDAFCEENFLRPKAMLEINKLREQLKSLVRTLCPGVDDAMDANMKPPSDLQTKVIRQIIAAGYIDQIAIRRDLSTNPPTPLPSWETAKGIPYETMWSDDPAYIHPTSALYDATRTGKAAAAPPMVAYQELVRSAASERVWLKGVTSIHPKWMSKLGGPLCVLSRPAHSSSGSRMQAILAAKRTAAGGGVADERAPTVVVPLLGPKSWPLPSQKAVQRRVNGRWMIEET